jgi:hypothetical protein
MSDVVWSTLLEWAATLSNAEQVVERLEDCRRGGGVHLDLSYCLLTELPPELGQLSNLKVLGCYGNRLEALPSELGQLSNLKVLWCQGNLLEALPPDLGHLSNLKVLECGVNRLEALPSELGRLSNLEALLCHDNRLTTLPCELGQLSNLVELWCYNNPCAKVTPENLRAAYQAREARFTRQRTRLTQCLLEQGWPKDMVKLIVDKTEANGAEYDDSSTEEPPLKRARTDE